MVGFRVIGLNGGGGRVWVDGCGSFGDDVKEER